jgi:hypothetical protein
LPLPDGGFSVISVADNFAFVIEYLLQISLEFLFIMDLVGWSYSVEISVHPWLHCLGSGARGIKPSEGADHDFA